MWAVAKKGGSRFVQFGLHDGVAADVVFDIGNTTFRCLFGLPDRRTRVYNIKLFFFIHASDFPILFFLSSALVLAIIFCISPMSILYNTKNFFMRFLHC